MKKPLNLLENPIYPDIKQGPPRFRSAGKHWRVDEGRTLIDGNQDIPDFATNSVLIQSRDYNRQHAYGVSSHKDVVNLEFRPPLITMEDSLPLSRLPRPITVPRINPGTADDTSTRYTHQNNRPSEIHSYMTDRVKNDEWRPTFFCPIDTSLYDQSYDELELKSNRPQVSATAGTRIPTVIGDYLDDEIGGILDESKATYTRNNPHNPYLSDIETGLDNLTLESNLPSISVSSGRNVPVTPIFITSNNEVVLDYKRPQVSVTAGVKTPYSYKKYNEDDFDDIGSFVEDKIAPRLGISSSSPFKSDNGYVEPQKLQTPITYSYSVYKNVPFKTQNERYKVPFQKKKESLSSYKGYENRTVIPQKGIQTKRVILKQK
jgi:hypothetical protein